MGVFIGITPFWGFHTVLVLVLAVAFKLNKVLAFAASNISIPPMIPIIVLTSLKIGSALLGNEFISDNYFSIENIGNHLIEYVVGSFILAFFVAGVVGSSSYFLLKYFEKKSK